MDTKPAPSSHQSPTHPDINPISGNIQPEVEQGHLGPRRVEQAMDAPFPFEQLPLELQAHVQSFLANNDLRQLSQVSRSMHAAAYANSTSLFLPKYGARNFDNVNALLTEIGRYPRLKKLDFTKITIAGNKIKDTDFKRVMDHVTKEVEDETSCKRPRVALEELNLRNINISLEGVVLPASLRVLDLWDNQSVTNDSLKAVFARCTQLEVLDLSKTNLSLEGVVLPGSLRVLWLYGDTSVTDDLLITALALCTQLEELGLAFINLSLTDVVLPASLRVLNIGGNYSVTNGSLQLALWGNMNLKEIKNYWHEAQILAWLDDMRERGWPEEERALVSEET